MAAPLDVVFMISVFAVSIKFPPVGGGVHAFAAFAGFMAVAAAPPSASTMGVTVSILDVLGSRIGGPSRARR
ncbi:hypothetical protein HYPGJ_20150 [Hyphomicrobium sp. GJ21]|nr:hypothetical protein HYPGJ_20150 [Hyphomicrobium sp. GJ21]